MYVSFFQGILHSPSWLDFTLPQRGRNDGIEMHGLVARPGSLVNMNSSHSFKHCPPPREWMVGISPPAEVQARGRGMSVG